MENPKHSNHLEACSNGSKAASEKVYYCYQCDKVGKGLQMVHHHLQNNCDGKYSRKLAKTDAENRHRFTEAVVNTRIWQRENELKIATAAFESVKQSIISSIEEIRLLGNQAMEDAIKNHQNR